MSTGRQTIGSSDDSLHWAWLVIVCIGVVDILWARRAGFTFDGFPEAFGLIGVTFAFGLFYGYRERNLRYRDLGHYMALWLAFPFAVNSFSYLAATMGYPLRDAQFSALDHSIGFRWLR